MKGFIVRKEYANSYFLQKDHLNNILNKFEKTFALQTFLRFDKK